MPDSTSGQEPTQQTQTQEPPQDGAGDGKPQGGGEGSADTTTLTPEQAAAELARARQEAARYRNELRQAQTRVQEFEQAQMSEQERQQQRLQQLEAELQAERDRARTVTLQAEVVSEASSLGFHNPKAAARLMDQDRVEYDAEGKPQNVKDLLTELLRAEPYLGRGAGSADGGSGRDTTQPSDINDQIRRMAGRG